MQIMVTCHLACASKTANMSSLLALAAQGDDKIAGSQSEQKTHYQCGEAYMLSFTSPVSGLLRPLEIPAE